MEACRSREWWKCRGQVRGEGGRSLARRPAQRGQAEERARQIADERRNLASYLLLSGDHTISRFRLRLFQDLRKVEDTIRNDLLQWVQPPNSRGELRPVRDALPAQNTIVNTTWLGLDYEGRSGLEMKNVLRWQL